MRYGTPYSCGYGDPNNHFLYAIPDRAEMIARGYTSIPYRMKLRSGKDDGFVQIYRNASLYRVLPIVADTELSLDVQIPYASTSVSLMALYVGQLGAVHDISPAVRVEETRDSKLVTLTLHFPYEVIEPENTSGSYTSAWSLTGAVLGSNNARVAGHETWGRLSFTITVDAGTATIRLLVGDRVVASGSGAVGTTVTLAAVDSSGLSGSVAVAGGAANVTDGLIDIRWAKEVKVKRGTSNPPTAVVATVPFKGRNYERWTELAELTSNTTYYYRTTPVSDTNTDGTNSAVVSLTTTGAPAAPTSFSYSSGNAANITFAFTPAVPANTEFRLYLATIINGVLNLQDIKATATTGQSTVNFAGGITGSPGKTYALLRAYSTSTLQEEKNNNLLELEFDGAGAYVVPRPNTPGIFTATITGLDISVKGLYDPTREKTTATTLKLFKRTPAGSYNYASPDASSALAAAGANGLKSATLAYTFAGAGYYYIQILAATTGSVLSPSADAQEQLVYVSAGAMAAPSLTAELSRG